MSLNHPLLQAVTRNPLLIDPDSGDLLAATLTHLTTDADDRVWAADGEQDDFWDGWASEYGLRPYNVVNGVLRIPVQGVLLHRFPYQFGRWATGYAYVEKAVERGMADPEVHGIGLMIDSPGGEVAGCFECADMIFDSRGEKPIHAFASDHAYSAAYALASSAETISVTRSGGTGSVGVVTAHIDMSEALKKRGIKVTFIHAGKHKVDGNSYEKLPADVKARIQTRIDRMYGEFTETVARNRYMDDQAVRDTEALTYDAEGSVEVGFADATGSEEDQMAAFVALTQEGHMAPKTNPSASDAEATFTQADLDAAAVAARTEGMTAQKDRINAILGSDEAKDRPAAAQSAAMNTDLDADAAKAFLATLPKEAAAPAPAASTEEGDDKAKDKPKAKGTPFDSAMDGSDNPAVGADADAGDDDLDDDEKATASITSALRAAKGLKPKAA